LHADKIGLDRIKSDLTLRIYWVNKKFNPPLSEVIRFDPRAMNEGFMETQLLSSPPAGYNEWFKNLKERIRSAQQRAVLAANSEMLALYWQIGRDILERQSAQGWGAKVVGRLAADLRREFPEMKGFSRANLLYMRALAEAWPDGAFVQQLVGQIPWGHNITLLTKVKDGAEREWYARAAIENGWSRGVGSSNRIQALSPPRQSRHEFCQTTPGTTVRVGRADAQGSLPL
jgi:predicted nuclease of restriction endonuclease-like (RecB) superfamily